MFLILGAVALLVSRNPVAHRWTGDFLIQDLLVPGIIGLFILGVCLIIKYAANFPGWRSDIKSIGFSAGIVALTVLLLRLLKIKEKLARYAEQGQHGQVISLTQGKETQTPQPPASSPRSASDKKAA